MFAIFGFSFSPILLLKLFYATYALIRESQIPDSMIRTLDSWYPPQRILDSKRSLFWDSRFLDLDFGFKKVRFWVPQANFFWIPHGTLMSHSNVILSLSTELSGTCSYNMSYSPVHIFYRPNFQYTITPSFGLLLSQFLILSDKVGDTDLVFTTKSTKGRFAWLNFIVIIISTFTQLKWMLGRIENVVLRASHIS